MERIIEPEWLDELPADDPGAAGSRKDLQRLNWLMSHAHILARELRNGPMPKRVIDLGAGDGSFALRIATQLQWRNIEFVLLDRAVTVSDSTLKDFDALDCRVTLIQRDILSGLTDAERVDVIFANLFLHHFNQPQLGRLLGDVAAHCSFFVACEPRRFSFGLGASRLLGLIGCNHVTRHDAPASVRAGFRGSEVSQHWPREPEWLTEERATGLFSHLFVARKM